MRGLRKYPIDLPKPPVNLRQHPVEPRQYPVKLGKAAMNLARIHHRLRTASARVPKFDRHLSKLSRDRHKAAAEAPHFAYLLSRISAHGLWPADGKCRTFAADPRGDARSFSYDGAGSLTRRTDRNGRTLQFDHDERNRVTAEKWQSGLEISDQPESRIPNWNREEGSRGAREKRGLVFPLVCVNASKNLRRSRR